MCGTIEHNKQSKKTKKCNITLSSLSNVTVTYCMDVTETTLMYSTQFALFVY